MIYGSLFNFSPESFLSRALFSYKFCQLTINHILTNFLTVIETLNSSNLTAKSLNLRSRQFLKDLPNSYVTFLSISNRSIFSSSPIPKLIIVGGAPPIVLMKLWLPYISFIIKKDEDSCQSIDNRDQ